MRWLALLVTISCAGVSTPRPPPALGNASARPPTPIAIPASPDAEIDALAFLDGCWRYWSVDWGNEVCWRRVDDRWLGRYRSHGPMGPKETIDLVIRRRDGSLVINVRRSAPKDEPAKEQFAMTLRGPGYVVFGDRAIQMITAGPDKIDAQLSARSGLSRLTWAPR